MWCFILKNMKDHSIASSSGTIQKRFGGHLVSSKIDSGVSVSSSCQNRRDPKHETHLWNRQALRL